MFRRYLRHCKLALAITYLWFGSLYAESQTLPLDDLQRFTSVMEQVRRYYVKSIEDKQLFEDAIRGMLEGLDPHSAFLDPSEFSDLKANTSGKFGGLGIEVTLEENFIRVVSPIDDTPAQRAGIKAGDVIIKINDAPVKGLTLKKAVEMMRGEQGTSIMLTIARKGMTAPLKIKVQRDVIKVKSVKAKILDKRYGYVRISQFQAQSPQEMQLALQQLQQDSQEPLQGIVLDLRNNPGGILESSVKICDAFLDRPKLNFNGLIVYTEGRLPGSEIKETAHEGDVLNGAPIVVLVNGGSASASEIVAGALQDHHRAVIVGTPTFGKGSVQTVLPLKDNYGLKLTTALYFTPAGRSIQATGIIPDIEVPDLKLATQQTEDATFMIRESDLDNHLENAIPATTPSPTLSSKNAKLPTSEVPLHAQDYQLSEALNLLKGLALSNPQARVPNSKRTQKAAILLETSTLD